MSDKRGKKAKVDEEIDFKWGKKRGQGGKDKEYQFYDYCTYDGVEYWLYDSVYLFRAGVSEPFVAKILKMWEHKTKGRKVKLLWFFRPSEISKHLQCVKLLPNELFLATGEGVGLANINPLEAIAGKCNVLCISKDIRNRQPSNEEIEKADYLFYRTFNVQKLTVSDTLDGKIAAVDVEYLLNKSDPQSAAFAMLDVAVVEVDAATPLNTVKDTLGEDRLVDSNTPSAVKADKITGELAAEEEKTIPSKDARDVKSGADVGDVKSGADVGPSSVREDRQSLKKGTSDNKSVVPSSKSVSESGQETTSRSPDFQQTDLKKASDGGVILIGNMKSGDKGISEGGNSAKRRVATAENFKSEDKLSKKLRLDGTARKTISNGGTCTQKSANVSLDSNKVSETAGNAAENNIIGKLKRESDGISDAPPKKQKQCGITPVTSGKTSAKSSKDLKNFVSKAPLPPSEASECNDLARLSRERDGTSEGISKKRKISSLSEQKPSDKLDKMSNKQPNDDGKKIGAFNQVKEVAQRRSDTSKWFTASPWEDRMKDACEQERLVLLQNLDPTYNSIEVESIIWHGFEVRCTAQIVQRTATSSPHSGQALAIFNNRNVALKVIGKLERDCLMLPNGSPLVGTIHMSLPAKQPQYFGQLAMGKHKYQTPKDTREAVSTSHAAQSNTIEYEMALEWRLLQDRSNLWWQLLYQKQGEEISNLKANLKSK